MTDTPYVVAYIDHLSKLYVIFNVNDRGSDQGATYLPETTKEYPGYSPEYFGYVPDGKVWQNNVGEYNLGYLYYFQNKQEYVFPKEWNNRWILCRLYSMFPSSDSESDESWTPKAGGDQTSTTALYEFYLAGVFDTEADLLAATDLHGFENVVNDNQYISRPPLVNEYIHFDNGIISNSMVKLQHYLNVDNEKWDQFEITEDTVIDPHFELLKMLDGNHETPER